MLKLQIAALSVMVATLVSSAWHASTQTTDGGLKQSPIISATDAPAGSETLAVKWIRVAVPDLGVMLAAVARPAGAGPFPVVILLHGTHGFARQYVQLAQDLARGGLLAVAPCWFSGGSGAGLRFVTPIACPEAPPMPTALSPEALQTVDALVQAARGLSGARPDRIGLFGHSRGGGATLNYLLNSGLNVQAAVLENTGYPTLLADRASQITTPLLMLHGTANSPDDGGSALADVQMARNFEAALRRAGKPVDAKYYEGGGHNSFFSNSPQHDDEVTRIQEFFLRHLGN
jgi:carboxymethylenebutenolidase